MNTVLPLAQTWPDAASVPCPSNVFVRFDLPGPDIAPVLLFLASAEVQYITGSSLAPDGGFIINGGH